MILRIAAGNISGTGKDADGDFDLDGNYDSGGDVAIVRRYTYCTAGPEGIGIPYLYRGRWNGTFISGTWGTIFGPHDGGTFEMWPEDGSLELNAEEALQAEPVLT